VAVQAFVAKVRGLGILVLLGELWAKFIEGNDSLPIVSEAELPSIVMWGAYFGESMLEVNMTTLSEACGQVPVVLRLEE